MKSIKKTLYYSFVFFLLSSLPAQDYTGGFEFDGYDRKYEVYLPQNFKPNMPLVVSIHGYSETIQWYKTYTDMHVAADTMGFVLVYRGYSKEKSISKSAASGAEVRPKSQR